MSIFTNPVKAINATFSTIASWFDSLPTWVKSFVNQLKSDEGVILSSLVDVAKADILANGLTTESFVAAAKDVYAQLVAKNITKFTLQYVFAAINAAIDAENTAAK